MSVPNQYFSETHLIGPECTQNEIDSEHFPALTEAPFRWVGYSVLKTPYRMVRMRSVHSHIVASIQGTGHVWIDDTLVPFPPGSVMLGPVGCHHAFEAPNESTWTIAWVFYEDSIAAPALHYPSTRLVRANVNAFSTVLRSLLMEASGPAQYSAMSAWVHLLHLHCQRIIGSDSTDERLSRLWMHVEGRLSHSWSVAELSKLAGMSEEHLRRLCHRYYNRSPIEHLSQLRLRRAATLLKSTNHKVDTIAQHVGYGSMYSFSVAFKRWKGCSPRTFRFESTPSGSVR